MPVLDELRAGGWKLRDGLAPDERVWRLDGLRLVCVGHVSGRDDAAAAVLAAARGAGLVVTVSGDGPVLDRLVEDLARIGNVTIARDSDERLPTVGGEDRRILDLLASGATLEEVAQTLNYSLRTIERRLAAIRTALDVDTTAAAISRVSGGPSGSAGRP